MTDEFVIAHLRKLQITAERLARAGLLTEQIVEDLGEARLVLWLLQGGPPDA